MVVDPAFINVNFMPSSGMKSTLSEVAGETVPLA